MCLKADVPAPDGPGGGPSGPGLVGWVDTAVAEPAGDVRARLKARLGSQPACRLVTRQLGRNISRSREIASRVREVSGGFELK